MIGNGNGNLFKFDVVKLNEILSLLASLPFGQVNSIINDIHQQAQPQVDEFNLMMEEKMSAESEEKNEVATAD